MRWLKPPLFAFCLTPAGWLIWKGLNQDLGANPIEFMTHATGDWTLRLLLLTLAITPVRKLAGLPQLIRFRRMIGLFAFFYGCLHFLTYIWLDKFFNVHEALGDITKRPYVTTGFAGFLFLIPLSVTSTTGWIRRLGGRRWQMLHRLVYASGMAGVVHYYWLVKSDIRLPVLYAAILLLLLSFRAINWLPRRGRRGFVPSVPQCARRVASAQLPAATNPGHCVPNWAERVLDRVVRKLLSRRGSRPLQTSG